MVNGDFLEHFHVIYQVFQRITLILLTFRFLLMNQSTFKESNRLFKITFSKIILNFFQISYLFIFPQFFRILNLTQEVQQLGRHVLLLYFLEGFLEKVLLVHGHVFVIVFYYKVVADGLGRLAITISIVLLIVMF